MHPHFAPNITDRVPLDAYSTTYHELLFTAGTHTSVLLTGGLITAGISGIFFLSKDTHGPKQQRIWLRVYILALIFLLVAFDVVAIMVSHESTIFYFYSNERRIQLFRILPILYILLGSIIVILTDGILVCLFHCSKRYDV